MLTYESFKALTVRAVRAFFFVSLFFVLPGASCQTHIDGGVFMAENGESYYWDTAYLPIRVYLEDSIRPEVRSEIRLGVEEWNRVLHEEIFVAINHSRPRPGRPSPGTIGLGVYPLGMQGRNRVNGQAEITRHSGERGEIHSAMVRIRSDLDSWRVYGTTIHELGHTLGLRHDDNPRSIMYSHSPSRNCSYRSRRLCAARVTPEDIQHIHRMLRRTIRSRQYYGQTD